ncbi:MAG TPA: Fe-S cluster assembly ATPase SufC [Candidatus Diapherotrites archaeon]|uniref:Fe-S cluster assembly ATPase SufC n=1 Tax=Candidatus Iainarchaeum sp. TaxID=3101447 RepID=A0A7J4J072_9ARCH|nr:Fe-S cluster assembly ATPase SufC [Candidatus Diapherotrites archaeon]
MANALLEIKNLHAETEGKEILKGVNLSVGRGEIHALMGPNGSGKSTLSNIIFGSPKYKITKGDIRFRGKSILSLDSAQRANLGMFLSFQYPFEIAGLSLSKFLLAAYRAQHPLEVTGVVALRDKMNEAAEQLHLPQDFIERELNVGFSGGEKKRAEILQMMVLKPQMAVLDETDSGLDIDSLKFVCSAVGKMRSENFSALVITHYNRILGHLKPNFVHIMHDGRIVKEGRAELAEKVEKTGYRAIVQKAGK